MNDRYETLIQGPERTLLAFLDDPVVVLCPRGRVAYLNPAFRRKFRLTREGAIGKPLAEVLPGVLAEAVMERIGGAAVSGASYSFWIGSEPDRLKISLAAIERDGRRLGAIVTVWDTRRETSLKKRNLDLFRAMLDDALLPLEEVKALVCLPQALDQSRQCGAETQVGQLFESLSRLRDFGEVLFGQVRTERASFQPARLISLVRKSLRPLAEQRKVLLEDGCASELPAVVGDPALLNRILGLLVDYMIKNAPAGELVVVSAALPEMNGGPPRLFYSITSTGALRVPIEFGEGEQALSIGFTGLDDEKKRLLLKLLLARRLVAALDGELSIAAHEQAGATISISAPVTPQSVAE